MDQRENSERRPTDALHGDAAELASVVADLSHHAVFSLDGDGRVRSWSAGAERLTGWDRSEIVGTHVSVLCPAGGDGGEAVDFERALDAAAREDGHETTGWLTRRDGAAFWGAVTVRRLGRGDHDDARYGAVVCDRTEQKRVAAERRLLVELNRAVTGAESFAEGVRLALEAVCDRTRWVYAEAWAPPDATGTDETADLELVATHLADPSVEGFRDESEGWTFGQNEGLPGRVWASGEPEWIPDVADATVSAFNRTEMASSHGLGAALGVPITAGEEVVAALTFFLRCRREIDERLAEVVAAVADELGRLLFQKREEERLRRREQSLRTYRAAIERAGHAIYVTDVDGTIRYVNPTFEATTGYEASEVVGETPAVLSSGLHDDSFYGELWETILAGDIWTGEVVNRRASGERYVVNQTIAPIPDENGDVERFVAVNTDVTDRKRRRHALERQRDRLARHHTVMATMWAVTQALVDASTERELRESVCESLVRTEFCDVAWVGTYDKRAEALTPTACAGTDVDDLDVVSLSADGATDEEAPCREAVRSRAVAVSRPGTGRETMPAWRDTNSRWGYPASAAVPLVHEGVLYGTLNLRADRPLAFDGDERAQLEGLGDAVAHGLDAVKTRKLLHADQVIELEFRSGDERSLLVEASTASDCALSLAGTVPLSDDRALLYVHLDDVNAAGVGEVADRRDGVDAVRVVDDGDDGVRMAFDVRADASLAKRFIDCGASVEAASAANGRAAFVVQVAPDTDVRALIDEVRAGFPDLELVAKRERERTRDVDRSYLERLSDRQRASLAAAYYAGYFEWPRESTAEEVASAMGISGPTFHKHLRRAEHRLLDEFLDRDSRERMP